MSKLKPRKKVEVQFYVNEEKGHVYAVAHFYGKIVKGTAKCSPQDEFDVEKGKQLAEARLRYKMALIRKHYYDDEINALEDAFHDIIVRYETLSEKLDKCLVDSMVDVRKAEHELDTIQEVLK